MLVIKNQVFEIQGEPLFEMPQVLINQPTIIGLVGKNGSGKTTLLKHIEDTIDDARLIEQIKPKTADRSGGEVTKEYLLDAMNSLSSILLLDEPTTHLDENNRDWLIQKIKRLPSIVIITSHDRYFLDAVVKKIWAIDDDKLEAYDGNYTHYKEVLEHRKKRHEEEYRQYINEKNEIEKKIARKRDQASRSNVAPGSYDHGDDGSSPYFNKVQKKLFKSAKAFESRMDRLEEVDQPDKVREVRFYNHDATQFGKKFVLRYEGDVTVGERLLIHDAKLFIRNHEKVAITGPNGSGKTTLLKKVLSKNDHINVGYFHQQLESLDTEKSIMENVQEDSLYDATTIRTMLSRLNIKGDKVFEQVKWISGGERIKVQLVKVLVGACDVLVLDEPTNFLDIDAVEALESMLEHYPNTVIVISHDRRFIDNICTLEFKIVDKALVDQSMAVNDSSDDANELLIIENKISQVLSDLSVEATPELEEEFQKLVKLKREISDIGKNY
ncbi:ribosomal protection-like ABC-F family protein [Aliicoccus persicus]|uniref:Pleuromutilin/lincosamide/streptogramin A transport system ATP-binding/permease protein n=1 Tax=Aliicoccus persicus TaxID=930138 RepID=A0A662Z4D3_9STAP|nr:ATP-binding cassette domain-containing protein [Aliicoccus persicus]SEV93932.1 pleuromutilin/lincosamide/streptogramin A transport system ATP-binding/permease protein [Aliicoccus persicus]